MVVSGKKVITKKPGSLTLASKAPDLPQRQAVHIFLQMEKKIKIKHENFFESPNLDLI